MKQMCKSLFFFAFLLAEIDTTVNAIWLLFFKIVIMFLMYNGVVR